MGLKDMLGMLKDAASMQRNMKKIQSQLRQKTVEFSSGGGKVVVTARGDASIAGIRIDPSVMDPARPAALEKLIMAALEGALEAAKRASAEEVRKLAGEMGLPPGLVDG
jgi:hypothetical protein